MVKKAPAKKAPVKGNVSAADVFDKKESPKHYAAAVVMLKKKTFSFDDLYEAADGLSPRTLATVLAALSKAGVHFNKKRTAEEGTVYHRVDSAREANALDTPAAERRKAAGARYAARSRSSAKKTAAKKPSPKRDGGASTAKKAPAKKAPAKKAGAKVRKRPGRG